IPDSRFTIPDSRFPIPDSRFPIPDSRFPIPDSRFPLSKNLSNLKLLKKIVYRLLKLIQSISLAILILSVSVLPVFAQESLNVSNQDLPMVSTANDSQLELTKFQDIEKFSDDFFVNQMAENHIPGAVFTLVKDDKILFSKGYGYANLEDKIPVIPNKTLFRVGSVSKLVTSTAVMQLVEQGKLKLHEDINQYLK
ncbi:MAG: beta-lactamase family protein, partial [Moorea sp. SIO4E2]|nr:beta-lactamase family protein [Moorena sp. SIO4E2]